MLQSLKIENIAVIESAHLTLSGGFNVLTGETGAGKSIIIDAINAVLGERTSRELVRTGADSARVSALFVDVSKRVSDVLAELDIEPTDDGSLLLQRSIAVDGRNNCRVNGFPVTVAILRRVGHELIDIHGQHDSRNLLRPELHYEYLDSFAGHDELLNKYKKAYRRAVSIKNELNSLNIDDTEKTRRLDMLYYQINELEAAGLTVGEREELSARRALLQNAERLITVLRSCCDALGGSDDFSGASLLAEDAARGLEEAAPYFDDFTASAAALHDASFTMSEITNDIRARLSTLEFDEAELLDIEERLDVIYRLSKKYGESEEAMLAFLEDANRRVREIELSDSRREELEASLKDAARELEAVAGELSESRRRAALEFSSAVRAELDFLDMPGVVFSVRQEKSAYNSTGADSIEFLISANAGEEPKPLAKIASGGELSRVMLAFKNVLSAGDDVQTLIFDEIDTGVSGSAARKIALKLREAARSRQVICVTHLAIIAAYARHHFAVRKNVVGGKTFTEVAALGQDARKHELARIIGGGDVTEIQLKNAEEMLNSALKL